MFNRVTMTWRQGWRSRWPRRALVLTPAFGWRRRAKQRPPAVSLSFDKISTFTPADRPIRGWPRSFAGRGASIADFKFTPAAAKGRPSQVRVAIRARGAPTPAPPGRGRGRLAGQRPDPGQL